MSKFKEYLEAVKKIAGSQFKRVKESDSFENGDIVIYEGKRRKVESDEGDKLILKGISHYVWKTDCEHQEER